MHASISLKVNGRTVTRDVETRKLLVEFIRNDLGLTGTHVGCDSSQCGACTVHLNGRSIKSCSILAVQVDGADVLTIEGLSDGDELHPVQQAFHEKHGLQCGFCTPGMVMSVLDLLKTNPQPDDAAVRWSLEGNLCRCTGYQNIVDAALLAADRMAGRAGSETARSTPAAKSGR